MKNHSIKNNCSRLILNAFGTDTDKSGNTIVKILNDMERKWDNEQSQLVHTNITDKS